MRLFETDKERALLTNVFVDSVMNFHGCFLFAVVLLLLFDAAVGSKTAASLPTKFRQLMIDGKKFAMV